MTPGQEPAPPVAVGPHFKMVLRWTGTITLVALAVAILVAFVETYGGANDSASLDRIMDFSIGIVELGFGAIIGLLGGKHL